MNTEKIYKSFIKAVDEDDNVPTVAKPLSKNYFERFLLTNKVSVITGGLGGIAKCIAKGYAEAGSHIVLLDYVTDDKGFCEELSKEHNVKCKFYQLDVTKDDKVREVVEKIVEDFGKIDVFVANAGITWYKGRLTDCNNEDWHKLMDVNLNGVFYCAKYVGKVFEKQKSGSFIITASMSAHIVNVPHYKSAYNASKAAVKHLAKSLAVEWAGFARCNSVSPGYTSTVLMDLVPDDERAKFWGMTPMGREVHPDELVGAYIYLASDASSATMGADIIVDGGFTII